MPFSKTFQWEFLKSPLQISVPYVKVGTTKAFNKWDLSSQRVTPTIVSFLDMAIKALILVIIAIYLMHNNIQLHDCVPLYI